jgi:hypothetical protein
MKNKMKKIVMLLMLLVSLASANAKCDWSSLKLQQANDRNYYQWKISGKVLDDTCVNWMFMIYDFQTKKTDTLRDNRGLAQVQFNVKGKYKMYLKVWDKCKKCDTALYREVNIVQFPGAKVTITPSVNALSCKKYKFELSYIKGLSVKDTCMDYYLVFYAGPWMDKMSQGKWDSLTDYQIGTGYDFPDADYLGYTDTRIVDYTFKNSGRVLMIAQWWNKCVGQDTFMFRKLDVCKTTTKPKCDWSKLGFGYGKPIPCNVYKFELGSIDSCITYTSYIYNYKTQKWTDTFTTRTFTKVFTDTGKYKVYVVARNKCGGCDTSYYNFVTVTCNPTSGVDEIIKEEPKLIRMYDMMGRPVYNARENEITIYLYSDGSTRKIIKK